MKEKKSCALLGDLIEIDQSVLLSPGSFRAVLDLPFRRKKGRIDALESEKVEGASLLQASGLRAK